MSGIHTLSAPVHALLDAEGRLRDADEPIAALQAEAGGLPDGPLAIPALSAIVRLALRLSMPISRPVDVARDDRDVSMWVRAVPEADGLRLSITDWVERAPRLMQEDKAVAARVAAASTMGWTWQIDSRMRFRVVDAAPEMGHLPPVPGEPLTAYFVLVDDDPPVDGSGVMHPMPVVDALASRAPFHRQMARLRSDPAIRYSLSAVPMFDLHGHLLGYRGSAVRAETEEAQDAATLDGGKVAPDGTIATASGLFGADLSRRLDQALRQPLGRIIANASTMSGQIEGPLRQDYADYAADIAAAGRHLVDLVDDLADLQAIERPDFSTAREEVDLADLARRAAGLLIVRAASRRINIVTPAIGETALACAEYRRALQILVNLVGNAVRYAPDDSSVWIRVEKLGGRAIVVVADQGRGIDPADHARVFDRFERLSPQDSEGSGLGLYISRTLARAMGGDITLESALGQGARFRLDLPAWVTSEN